MRRLITFNILLMVFWGVAGYAQDGIDHGPTGTLNLDYFNPQNDRHIAWLINDQNKHHLEPAFSDFAKGDMKGAMSALDWLLVRFVNHPEALSLAGIVARATKNLLWAVPHYERALRVYPQYALTHAQYGKFLVDIGSIDAGIEKLKTAVEMDRKLGTAYGWLAAAYSKKGNTALARENAEQARSLGYKGNLSAYGLN